jgi:5-methylcytosine-specific restriction endonuclease McrA
MSIPNTIKRITVDLTPPKKTGEDDDHDHGTTHFATQTAVPKKRSVTALDSWQFSPTDLQPDMQRSYIKQLHSKIVVAKQPCKVIQQHIMQKLNGYKAQDVKKGFHDPEKFADVEYVIQLLEESSNFCYYCKDSVQVLYENVREPKQWSLDRIYNNQGHNKGNLVIACLKCNLSRKTMYHERYAFTKQLVIVKQN